jgi:arginine-tRNA-protein transferase
MIDQPLVVLSPPEPCAYLPDQIAQMRYELAPDLTAAEYLPRLASGWRRFGAIMFRHDCPSCRRCESLRIPVARFRQSSSQRRVWKRNVDEVEVRVGQPVNSPERLELFRRFHRFGHETKGWPTDPGHDLRLFTANPFPTEEWAYYIREQLACVAYVDSLPDALSPIYFFHDPRHGRRMLGTLTLLRAIQTARERGLSQVYLGYYVEGCRSLEYKRRFQPNERLNRAGRWEAADGPSGPPASR